MASGYLLDHDGDGVLRIACLGDSNTALLPPQRVTTWCDELPAMLPRVSVRTGVTSAPLPIHTRNYGIGGAAVCPALVPQAMNELATALDDHPDLIIAAFTTNDVRLGRTPQQIVACFQALQHAAGAIPMIVLGPPVIFPPDDDAAMAAAATALEAAFRGRYIDSRTGFVRTMYSDGVHLNTKGQLVRARRVKLALEAAAARSVVKPARRRSRERRT
jgi:lysophospholipase L1-like esterase